MDPSKQAPKTAAPRTASTALQEPLRVLVADDSAATRRLISGLLARWGHEVLEAADGSEAWEILQSEPVSLVITDWMMPGLSGPELCRRIRQSRTDTYDYLIVLTEKSDHAARVAGLEAGADDFLSKPCDPAELKARLEAGARVVRLERGLAERNLLLTRANEALAEARRKIERDLVAATKVQRRLLPATPRCLQGWRFASLFVASTWISGDLFDFYAIDERRIGFYHLDVAGHGVAAALFSAGLSRELSPSFAAPAERERFGSPARLLREINAHHPCDDVGTHFTIVQGVLDSQTGQGRFVQAGHPHPVLVPRGRPARLLGDGGVPVGLLRGTDFEEVPFAMTPGDRLFLCSDGLLEAPSAEGQPWGEARLVDALEGLRDLELGDAVTELGAQLRRWRGCEDSDDDVSVLAIEAPGNGRKGEES